MIIRYLGPLGIHTKNILAHYIHACMPGHLTACLPACRPTYLPALCLHACCTHVDYLMFLYAACTCTWLALYVETAPPLTTFDIFADGRCV